MELTSAQLELFAKLESGLYSLSNLSQPERILLTQTLRPTGPFTEQQKDLLENWYLITTDEQVAECNQLLAPKFGISSKLTIDSTVVVNADLLTDCLNPSDNYHPILHVLFTLNLIRLTLSSFPILEDNA